MCLIYTSAKSVRYPHPVTLRGNFSKIKRLHQYIRVQISIGRTTSETALHLNFFLLETKTVLREPVFSPSVYCIRHTQKRKWQYICFFFINFRKASDSIRCDVLYNTVTYFVIVMETVGRLV